MAAHIEFAKILILQSTKQDEDPLANKKKAFAIVLDIINGNSEISLRVLDWFVTRYSKRKIDFSDSNENTIDSFDVHISDSVYPFLVGACLIQVPESILLESLTLMSYLSK